MKTRRFTQVDVFTGTPYLGNALAVVVDGDDLSDEQMQTFARWTNLAETTFLQTPDNDDADYKVRIFTPSREMPFAGHPTLGSCAAWLDSGGNAKTPGKVIQQCNIGLVEIDYSAEIPAFIAPPTGIEAMEPATFSKICDIFELAESDVKNHATLDNGPVWQVVELDSAEKVLGLDSTKVRWPELGPLGFIGITGKHQNASAETTEPDYEVRMLAPSSGMTEDPITGSLNAALAKWFQSQGRLERDLLIAQGTQIDRCGRVYISQKKDGSNDILIGGQSHILVKGEVKI